MGGLAGRLPFPGVDIAAAHAVGGTNWDALTAVGTMALALVTLAAVVTTIVITKQDRERAGQQLLDERAAADRRYREERDHAQEAEQLAQAWAVEVLPGHASDRQDTSNLSVMVGNMSTRTVTRVEVQFSPDGKSLVMPKRSERLIPQNGSSTVRITSDLPFIPPDGKFSAAYSGILIPGRHMRFWSDEISDEHLSASYPVVRWSDWLGQRWEHRKGTVRKVDNGEPWVP